MGVGAYGASVMEVKFGLPFWVAVPVGGVLAAWALPGSWDYVRFMAREGTPVLGLPFSWVFLPFVLMLASLALHSAWGIVRALRGQGLEDAGLPP